MGACEKSFCSDGSDVQLSAGVCTCDDGEVVEDADCLSTDASSVRPVVGHWSGEVTDLGSLYPVCITVGKDSSGTDRYDTLQCTGELSYRGRWNDTWVFEEKIFDNSRRIDGRVELTNVSKNVLSWEWHTDGAASPRATATLDEVDSCE